MDRYTLIPAPPEQSQAVRRFLGKLLPGDRIRVLAKHPESADVEPLWFLINRVDAEVSEATSPPTIESMSFPCRRDLPDGSDVAELTITPEYITEVWFVRRERWFDRRA